jgi:hypothetical protein
LWMMRRTPLPDWRRCLSIEKWAYGSFRRINSRMLDLEN